MKDPCVYILASGRRGTLYTGVTSDLKKRGWQHKSEVIAGFTAKYGVKRLVWFDRHSTMDNAIHREKIIKGWSRVEKIQVIEELNPEWRDLYEELFLT